MAPGKRHAGAAKYSSSPEKCLRQKAIRRLFHKAGVTMFRKSAIEAARPVMMRIMRRAAQNAIAMQVSHERALASAH